MNNVWYFKKKSQSETYYQLAFFPRLRWQNLRVNVIHGGRVMSSRRRRQWCRTVRGRGQWLSNHFVNEARNISNLWIWASPSASNLIHHHAVADPGERGNWETCPPPAKKEERAEEEEGCDLIHTFIQLFSYLVI